MDIKKRIIRTLLYLCGIILLSENEIRAEFPVACPVVFAGDVTWTFLNSPDNFFGGSVYFPVLPQHGLSAYSSIIFRAGNKPVLKKTTETSYIQYRERRFVWDVGIDESISFPWHIGFFTRGGIGYTHAWYRGSSVDAETGLTPTAQAGIFFFIRGQDDEIMCRFRIGYSYANTRVSGPHGFSGSFQIGFGQ